MQCFFTWRKKYIFIIVFVTTVVVVNCKEYKFFFKELIFPFIEK